VSKKGYVIIFYMEVDQPLPVNTQVFCNLILHTLHFECFFFSQLLR